MDVRVNAYKINAFDALRFKLIRKKEDIDSDFYFNPDMTHQVFGESEVIFGYKELEVDLAFTAGGLSTFVDIKYSEKVPMSISDGVEPDDIMKSLKSVFAEGLYTDKSEFLKVVEADRNFKPFGEVVSSYTVEVDDRSREFDVFYVDHATKNFDSFSKYLLRMEPFLLFFIDEACYIELDDRWSFYVLYEKFLSENSNNTSFAFVGYASVYKFYAYPENIRPRISQIVILPPFQKMGHATRLLETIYDSLVSLPKVIDVTMESPSEDLSRLRDYLDSKRCLQREDCLSVIKAVCDRVPSTTAGGEVAEDYLRENARAPEAKRRRLSAATKTVTPAESASVTSANAFYEAVRRNLKLSRTQTRRVYQILLYFFCVHNKGAHALASFKKALLKRIRVINERARALIPPIKMNVVDELVNEEYEKEIMNQVESDLAAYERIAEKLEVAIEDGEVNPKGLTAASKEGASQGGDC